MAALFLFAFLLRALYLYQLTRTPLIHSPGLDAAYYLDQARSIAAGNWMGRDVFFMGPLYAYVLALMALITGFELTRLLFLQSLLGSAGPVLLYVLARRLCDRTVALVAAIAMALYGMLILYDNQFLMEWLLGLLGLWALLALARVGPDTRRGPVILAGAVLGIMALGRASLLLFAPGALVWLWFASRHRSRLLIAYLAGLALVIAPVTLRNWVVGGDTVLISSNGGLNLYIGNNPLGRGTYIQLDQVAQAAGLRHIPVDVSWMITDPSGRRLAEAALGQPLKPSAVSAFYTQRTLDYVRAQPGRALRILGRKLLLFWNATEIAQIEDPALYRDLIPLLRAPLVTFAWAGPLALTGLILALSHQHRRRLGLPLLFVAAFTIGVVLFFVTARYRAPLVPVLLLFAAFAVVEIWRRGRRALHHGTRTLFSTLALPLLLVAGSTAMVHLDLVTIDRAASYISLGIALADEGRDEEAIAAFERAVAAAPGDPVARYNLGAALLKAGRPVDAIRVFHEAVTRAPGSVASWTGLGESHARLGEAAAAAQAFRRAVAIDGRNPYLWMRLGGTEFIAGRPDSALAALERGLALDPGNVTMQRMRDDIHMRSNAVEEP